ncbi:MAG: hypothetical protein IKJ55_04630, partial [Clostridia bacterium]|nr:hypothetical protein [Clostridia bacterium]
HFKKKKGDFLKMHYLFSHLNSLKGFPKFAYLICTAAAFLLLGFCLILRFFTPLTSALLFFARTAVETASGIFSVGLIFSVLFRFMGQNQD